MKVSVGVNTDFQGYKSRLSDIKSRLRNPFSVEFFVLPNNLVSKGYSVSFPKSGVYLDKFPILSEDLASSVASELGKYDVRYVQFHYPWQNTLLDMDGSALEGMIHFCNLVLKDCKNIEGLSVNCHNGLHKFSDDYVSNLDGSVRRKCQRMLLDRAEVARLLVDELGFEGSLLTENNPARSGDVDNMLGRTVYDCVDLVPRDFLPCVSKGFLDGVTLDLPHASSVAYCAGKGGFANIEWLKRSYPNMDFSLESFVKSCSPYVKWLHFSDERDEIHNGDHYGPCAFVNNELKSFNSSIVDASGVFDFVKKYCSGVIPLTIEVKDAHTPSGFDLIVSNDYPKLCELLKSKDILFE